MFSRRRNLWATFVLVGSLLSPGGIAAAQSDAVSAQKTLYDRLGGLAPISVVVDAFIDALVVDPFLNRNPAVDEARKRVPAPYLKFQVTSQVCEAAGGPCRYTGRSMKDSHAHLNITEQEWDRMVVIFKEILAKHQVPGPEQEELLAIAGSTKADIVTTGTKK